MANTTLKIKVLQASVDPDDESEFRILVDGRFTKYLTIDPGLYEVDDMCFLSFSNPLVTAPSTW